MRRTSHLELDLVKKIFHFANRIFWAFRRILTWWLKCLVHVTGSFFVSLFLLHSILFHAEFGTSTWCHLVSAEEKNVNHVGTPKRLIMANMSFFVCSQYGGDPLKSLSPLKPSFRRQSFSMFSLLFKYPAVKS